ncbi:MAG TPA: hopanoid biosynthesis-associated protein HpnK [Thermoanaerobaculia bacterium]
MPTALIVNADDFGRSPEINAAVLAAHREGILTSASLMVTGAASAEAVAMARATPSLAVGLHLVLVAGRSAAAPAELPRLVDAAGRFADDPVVAGLRLARPSARRELEREIAAQLTRFTATGLPLSHVDGHLHLHTHPAVLEILLPLAVRHGARGLRLPRDPLRAGLAWDRSRLLQKAGWALAFGFLSRRAAPRVRAAGLAVPERTHGLMQSGAMCEAYLLHLLDHLESATAEIYLHPTRGDRLEALGPNPHELAALLSPRVRERIAERGARLTTYAGLVAR